MRIDKNTTIRLGDRNIVKVKLGDVVIWQKEPDYFYVENTYAGGNTISVKQTITGQPDSSLYAKTLQYSKDKTNWTTITLSSTAYTITLNQGEKVYFRGNEGVLNYYANDGAIQAITNILGTQTHTIGGNINTLVNYITPNELTLPQGVFAELFQNNTTITSAENLTLPPSSDGSLPTFAYYLMFSGCSALITPPSEISATKQGHASCSKMFLDCIQLKTPPALKSTILGNYCFTSIFKNCTSLISAPELPALTLTPNCYQSAFEGCTSLEVAPELPATVLANYCYQALFKGCSALTIPPTIIPAKTAPYLSCHRMFNDCVSLQSAPELSPTTVGSGAYQYMFMGCSNIQTAPSELPAETLELNSYYEMFRGCSQLTTAPTIKAKTFAKNSCRGMFVSCSKLNNVTVYANDISATDCTSSWLSGVASTGTFNNYGSATYPTNSPSGIPSGWTVNSYGTDYLYIENTYAGSNTITFTTTQSGTPASGTYATSVECSKDKLTWNTINFDTLNPQTITLEQGEKLYLRNNSGYFNYTDDSNNYYTSITGSKSHKLGGNINTIINYTDLSNVSLSQGCFSRMFLNDIELVDASDLKLPSTTLAPHCYRAFLNNCQSLLYAPALPATTLANKCYYAMFYGDNSLISAPELPATTLVESCYDSIFKNCTSLTSVTIYATSTANGSFGGWLSNVAASGTVYNNGGVSLPKNSTSGIPTGWTEVKK